jgi:hypothetical protein
MPGFSAERVFAIDMFPGIHLLSKKRLAIISMDCRVI